MAKNNNSFTVDFKNVAANKNSITAGFNITRDVEIDPNQLDDLFTGKSLDVKIQSVRGDVEGQQELIKGGTDLANFDCECMGFNTHPDHYAVKLRLATDAISIDKARENITFRKAKVFVTCKGTAPSLTKPTSEERGVKDPE